MFYNINILYMLFNAVSLTHLLFVLFCLPIVPTRDAKVLLLLCSPAFKKKILYNTTRFETNPIPEIPINSDERHTNTETGFGRQRFPRFVCYIFKV